MIVLPYGLEGFHAIAQERGRLAESTWRDRLQNFVKPTGLKFAGRILERRELHIK